MRINGFFTLPLAIQLHGCGNSESALAPAPTGEELISLAKAGDPGRRIFLRDLCGGDSWTPFGGCLTNGPVERPAWLERVLATGSHPLWAISPIETSVEAGITLEIVNIGGRPHSFTRVANFGGGILSLLNTREDTAIPAPECLEAFERIEGAGASSLHTFTDPGEQKYQCCFHPWMRSTVNVTESHGQ